MLLLILTHLRKFCMWDFTYRTDLLFFFINYCLFSPLRWATVPLIRSYTRMVHCRLYYFYTGCHQIGNFYIMETAPVLWIHEFQLLTSYTRIFKNKTHFESSNYVSLWLVWGQQVHQGLCVDGVKSLKERKHLWRCGVLLDC